MTRKEPMTETAERFTDEELISVHELDRDGVQAR